MKNENQAQQDIVQALFRNSGQKDQPPQKPRSGDSMSTQSAIRAISMIFADLPMNAPQFSPQVRVILLTILLCATVCAMYRIYQSFLDTLILAFLSGVAYVKLRERFVSFFKKSRIDAPSQKSTGQIITQSVLYLLLIILIPWIRQEFSEETLYDSWTEVLHAKLNSHTINNILQAFPRSSNIIKMTQLYLFIKIIINLFGNVLQRLYFSFKSLIGKLLLQSSKENQQNQQQTKQRIESFLHWVFVITFIFGICIAIIVTAGIFFQFGSLLSTTGKAIELQHNCTFYDLEQGESHKEQCTEVISDTLKPYLPKIHHKEDIIKCINKLQQMQTLYVSKIHSDFILLEHKKQLCLIYQLLKQYSPEMLDHLFDIQVTKEYIASILANLVKVITLTSNTIFSVTTFISIFMVTIQSYTSSEQSFHLFGEHQHQLFSEITNLFSDYIMVTLKHLVLSLVLFEIFRFSELNIFLALLIAAIALFPLISATFIMLIFSSLKYYLTKDSQHMSQLSCLICLVLFYIGSGQIYKNHFNKIDFNKALISLSAVFGLYTLGVAGIFYGPIYILMFRCAYQSLGKIHF